MTEEDYKKEVLENDDFEDDMELFNELEEDQSVTIKDEIFHFMYKDCQNNSEERKVISDTIDHVHDNETPSPICGEKFKSEEVVNNHLEKKNETDRLHQCSKCEYRAKRKFNLKKHYERVHMQDKNFPCPTCGKVFKSKKLLQRHKETGCMHKCPLCDYKTKVKRNMEKHYEHVHVKEKNFSCPICGKEIKHEGAMKNHLKWHKEKEYIQKCSQCEYQTTNQSNLRKHIKNVHVKTKENGYINCPKCNILLPPDQVETHECVFYPCEICGKQFNSLGGVQAHKRYSHEGICEQKKCQECGKTFNNSILLQRHIDTVHERVTCHTCGEKVGKWSLKKHLQSHEEKTICEICKKAVRNMKNHIRAMHTPEIQKSHECPECGKGFHKADNMQRHLMSVHLKQRPYKCRYGCSFAYNDISNRNAHEKKSHGQTFKPMNEEEME